MNKNIRKYFYTLASPECDPHSGVFKPAVRFEIANDVSGVAAYYDFPGGQDPASYERYIRERYDAYYEALNKGAFCLGFSNTNICFDQSGTLDPALADAMKADWRELIALNPDLQNIVVDADNPYRLYDALLGAASLLNPDDIVFYLGVTKKFGPILITRMPDTRSGWSKLYNQVSAQSHSDLNWSPAPETMQAMKKLLANSKNTPK